MCKIKQFYSYAFLIIIVILCLCTINNNQPNKLKRYYKKDYSDIANEKIKVGDFSFSHNDSVMDMQQRKIPLCEILHNTNLLLLFSEYGCQPCIDNQIETLNVLCKNIESNKIIILAINYRHRDFIIFNQTHQSKFSIYTIQSDDLDLIAKKSPVYILLKNNLKIESIHIPIKEEPKATKHYLKIIKEKYLRDNKSP